MPRVKIFLPQTFSFATQIPIRITDINYGGHVGNDAILSLVHEARMHFLKAAGFSELSFGGVGLIMSDAAIEFKSEAFYGDVLKVYVAADEASRVGFELIYKLVKGEKETVVALAKTGMITFDYTKRKIAPLPAAAYQTLLNTQQA